MANLYSVIGLARECTFEELKLAYETLIKKETREEYDNYLDSLSANMEHEEELSEEDPDEK